MKLPRRHRHPKIFKGKRAFLESRISNKNPCIFISNTSQVIYEAEMSKFHSFALRMSKFPPYYVPTYFEEGYCQARRISHPVLRREHP
ncbi:hypothetical protein LINPERPRIM_LOCUS24940 [Linum perenne]